MLGWGVVYVTQEAAFNIVVTASKARDCFLIGASNLTGERAILTLDLG